MQEEPRTDPWIIDPQHVRVDYEALLSTSNFGSTYKGECRGEIVMVKKFSEVVQLSPQLLEDFEKEVAIMRQLSHPNVVVCMGACTQVGQPLMLVMEWCPGGSLWELVHQSGRKLSLREKLDIAEGTANGMNWLHTSDPPFVHTLLNSHNLLLSEDDTVRVSDFGGAAIKNSSKLEGATVEGQLAYMAPEILAEQPFDEKADIFSFGVVLWELFTGLKPWKSCSPARIKEEVIKNKNRLPVEGLPASLVNLLQSCWAHDPADRPSFADILNGRILEHVVVEDALGFDKFAVDMWTTNFLGLEEVEWSDFHAALRQMLLGSSATKSIGGSTPKLPQLHPGANEDTAMRALQLLTEKHHKATNRISMLASGSPSSPQKECRITLKLWADLLQWFGPLDVKVTRGDAFFQRIVEAVDTGCFFGHMSAREAQRQLADEKAGSWLLRFSSTPGCYTVSAVDRKGPKHFRITYKSGVGFSATGAESRASLADFLEKNKKLMGLKKPCGRSPFARSGTLSLPGK